MHRDGVTAIAGKAARAAAGAVGLVAVALSLASCDGDSHAHFRSSFHSGDDPHHQEGGVVIIWVHDDPADDLGAFSIAFTRVSLVPASGRAGRRAPVVYASRVGHRVELLSLRRRGALRFRELLVAADGVPPGRFDRVMVEVDAPELADLDGAPIAGAVRLARRAVEVALERPIDVAPGRPVSITLDFDVAGSLSQGPAKSWVVDPVIEQSPGDGEGTPIDAPVDIAGTMTLVRPGGRFELELDGGRGTVEVDAAGAAVFSGVTMAPAGLDALARGAAVTARGEMSSGGRFLASAVIAGDAVAARGTVRGEPRVGWDGVLQLEMLVVPGAEPSPARLVTVRVPASSPLTVDRVGHADADALADGDRVGVVLGPSLLLGGAQATSYAALVDIDGDGGR